MIGTVTMECPFAYVTQTLELTCTPHHAEFHQISISISPIWFEIFARNGATVSNAPVPAPTTSEESGPSACTTTAGSGTTGANTGTDSGAGAGTGNGLVTPGTPRDGLIAGYVDLGG